MMRTVGELCDHVHESVDPGKISSTTYVGLEHVDSGRLVIRRAGHSGGLVSAKTRFQAGDVLYGKLRPYLNKAAITGSDGVCSTELLVLRPKAAVPAPFLAAVLHTPAFLDHAVRTTHGVNHPRTSWQAISAFEVDLPPEDQWGPIGAALSTVDRTIDVEEGLVIATRDLKQAAMHEIFTRGLRGEEQKETEIGPLPREWSAVPLGAHLKRAQYGLSVRGQTSGRYPILRMNCQEDGQTTLRDLQYVDLGQQEFEAFQLHDGDLLFNRTNSYELVGRMSIFHLNAQAVFASYLIRLTLDSEIWDPDFVNYYFNWSVVQRRIKQLAARAVSQANINATRLRGFLVPLPGTLEEQRDAVNMLHSIDKALTLHEGKRSALEDLLQELLPELMTGRLDVGKATPGAAA